jgi:hypothetical protein
VDLFSICFPFPISPIRDRGRGKPDREAFKRSGKGLKSDLEEPQWPFLSTKLAAEKRKEEKRRREKKKRKEEEKRRREKKKRKEAIHTGK